jgi:hypothetical protein
MAPFFKAADAQLFPMALQDYDQLFKREGSHQSQFTSQSEPRVLRSA